MDEKISRTGSLDSRSDCSLATFGTGCFWCSEAVFSELDGVAQVVSGYSGGNVPYPNYEQVCTGTTGHAEVVQIRFDPARISYADLLEVFWATHDPTTLNRQGNDIGTQYRSVIYYHNAEQQHLARESMQAAEQAGLHVGAIVTEISPFKAFYPAERRHQDYFERNRSQPYCTMVIAPKVAKFRKLFRARLAERRD